LNAAIIVLKSKVKEGYCARSPILPLPAGPMHIKLDPDFFLVSKSVIFYIILKGKAAFLERGCFLRHLGLTLNPK